MNHPARAPDTQSIPWTDADPALGCSFLLIESKITQSVRRTSSATAQRTMQRRCNLWLENNNQETIH